MLEAQDPTPAGKGATCLQGMQHHKVAAPKSLYQTELRGARRSGKALVTWQLQFIAFVLKSVCPFAKNPSKKKTQPGSFALVTIGPLTGRGEEVMGERQSRLRSELCEEYTREKANGNC